MGQMRVRGPIGESTADYLLLEALWRLPVTLASCGVGFVAAYFLLRELADRPVTKHEFDWLRA